jgi:hypothetical protein
VGPRYNSRYRTAAESALYNCYRNVFEQILCATLRRTVLPLGARSVSSNRSHEWVFVFSFKFMLW